MDMPQQPVPYLRHFWLGPLELWVGVPRYHLEMADDHLSLGVLDRILFRTRNPLLLSAARLLAQGWPKVRALQVVAAGLRNQSVGLVVDCLFVLCRIVVLFSALLVIFTAAVPALCFHFFLASRDLIRDRAPQPRSMGDEQKIPVKMIKMEGNDGHQKEGPKGNKKGK